MSVPLSRTSTNNRTDVLHDKTRSEIIPTHLSPTGTSPTLTQSTSHSNSTPSTSPSHPRTPPRHIRPGTRYTELGRVPLHRRGNSKTYERLEDLLREAGYKETRIFTPEGERGGAETSERDRSRFDPDQRASVKGGVGAVVEFLTGLVPGTGAGRSSSLRRAAGKDEHAGTTEPPSRSPPRSYSPPVSPLAFRHNRNQKHRTSNTSQPQPPIIIMSSIESPESTPRARHSPLQSSALVPPTLVDSHFSIAHPSSQLPHRPQYQLIHRVSDQHSYGSQRPSLQTQASQASLRPPNHTSLSYNSIDRPRPSRAGAYLRHMASAPNMPRHLESNPSHNLERRTFRHNDSVADSLASTSDVRGMGDSDLQPEQPPLPRTWLECVARAVLFGGAGAYVGGPSISPRPASPPSPAGRHRVPTLRQTRSSISQVSIQKHEHFKPRGSRSGLSDQKNTKIATRKDMWAPPDLFTQIGRGRAGKSESEISLTRVVCKSAPHSRGGSRTRDGRRNRPENGKEKKAMSGKERGRERKRREETNRLPSLASTKTEGDAWIGKHDRAATGGHTEGGNRYLSGWGMELESDGDGDTEERQSSSEDEELDLAKMLVPPKRQNSIKSLRKHLATTDDGISSASANLINIATGIGVGRGSTVGVIAGSRTGSIRHRIQEDDWDGSEAEEWGRGWVRKYSRRHNSEDDEEGSYIGFLASDRNMSVGSRAGTGRSGTGKSRLGLPGPWALLGGGS